MISAKRLEKYFPGKGKELRGLIAGSIDPEQYKSVQAWIAQCYNEPSEQEQVEVAINEVVGGYGAEAIQGCSLRRPAAVYINLGDTYATTLLFDYEREEWEITSWGDWLEYQERHGQQFD